MRFSIVTPSFRNSDWLKLCIASVADQDAETEHIVQDACSDDGTQSWLTHDRRVRAFIEKDRGMYDAVNRGFARASGDILAYLNCDEQYLPGALNTVRGFFERNPRVDVVLSGTIIVDKTGNYTCHRQALTPHRIGVWVRFPILTCAVFIRRKAWHDFGLTFDARWRDLGDFHWILAMMHHRVRMAALESFTSAFTETGENMNLKPNAIREMTESLAMGPRWVRLSRPAWVLHHRLRRLAAGHFFLKPMEYSIYTLDSPDRRVTFTVQNPTAIWWSRVGASVLEPAK